MTTIGRPEIITISFLRGGETMCVLDLGADKLGNRIK